MKAHQIARLNTKPNNYAGGRGGIAPYTPQDIAGELARFNQYPIELLALCLRWWPGGIGHCRVDAENALYARASGVYLERQTQLLNLDLTIEQARLMGLNDRSAALADQRENLLKRRWPKPSADQYPQIFRGAFIEFQRPPRCKACGGSGVNPNATDKESRQCKACSGTGKDTATDNARAGWCGKHHHTFTESWAGLYAWSLNTINRAYTRALNRMRDEEQAQQQRGLFQ